MKLKSSIIYGLGILCFSACIASAQEGDKPKGPPQGSGQPSGGSPADRAAEFMKRADTDADGKISKEEFIGMSKKETDDRFGKADANSDGFIDQAEFTNITQRMREGAAGAGSPGMRRPGGEGGGEGGFRRPPGGEGGAPSGSPGAPPEGRRPEGGAQGGPPGGQGGRPGGGMFGDPKESFKRMDADANGSVSEAEYVAAMTKLREMMGSRGGQPSGQGMRRPEGGGAPGGEGGGGFRRPPTEGDKPDSPKPEGDKPAPDKPKDAV